MPAILWDWNGTLLDDTQAAIDTLNIMLAARGGTPIGRAFYRAHFAFPVKPFYESIGVVLADEDWNALAREYHEVYGRQPRQLNRETMAALERVRAVGARQSIISALRQDLLDRETKTFGVAPYMDFVCGVDNLNGTSKIERARELMARLDPADAVLIGDSLHDKEVADAVGIRCVLCGQGSHATDRLRAVAPTGETLLEAVGLALAPAGQ